MKKKDIKILLVDDEPDILDIVLFILKDLGCSVVTADSGEQAYKSLVTQAKGFDLLISDMQMPDMDGVRLAQKIRENSDLSSLKILFSTGNVNSNLENAEFKNLIDGYIYKPFCVDNFKQQLENLFPSLKDTKIA